jgi:hypothetical protein
VVPGSLLGGRPVAGRVLEVEDSRCSLVECMVGCRTIGWGSWCMMLLRRLVEGLQGFAGKEDSTRLLR